VLRQKGEAKLKDEEEEAFFGLTVVSSYLTGLTPPLPAFLLLNDELSIW
jgi:hypothetical protein